MKLSTDQIDFIKTILIKNGVEIQSLQDDLLDHLCCYIESRGEYDKDFEKLVSQGVAELAPFGLHVLQEQTLLLLHYNKLSNMKKLSFVIGALSAMAWFIGVFFTLMHWPGGREISLFGFLIFVFVFLPVQRMLHASAVRSPMEKWKFILGMTSGVLFSFSFIFKTFHLQGFETLFVGSTVFFVFIFLPYLFFSMYKKSMIQA
ncbi:MAG: hypothetical protein ABI477_15670 [Chryseolinea sp.]